MRKFELNIYSVIGTDVAISSDHATIIFNKISDCIEKDIPVELDFTNIKNLTTAFLNEAIGDLYGKFPHEKIKEIVSIGKASKEQLFYIKLVVDNAKEYYNNKDKRKMIDDINNELLNE